MAALFITLAAVDLMAAPTALFQQPATQITQITPEAQLIDFERVAFGNLVLHPPASALGQNITVRFGEALRDGRIDRQPPGTVRYAAVTLKLANSGPVVVAPPADARNTETQSKQHPPAILTPAAWGVVLPFRWVEIEGWPGELKANQVQRQAAFLSSWDDQAAFFESSDPLLNRIWQLCHYSIKATSFAGVYVDGDRERIPYEADAYINQLCHYACDSDKKMARDTFDHLMKHPTWPTEWAAHMIFMAHADWRHTGNREWLAPRYQALKAKLLLHRAGPDGLLRSNNAQVRHDDIVDWPIAERDGFVFTPINTVVNAFHLRALTLMAELAEAVNQPNDAQEYRQREQRVRRAFVTQLFDSERGLFRDGVGTDHCSLHANLFPLAFGLVPVEKQKYIAQWLGQRGMKCSVYAAQYLLEALFDHDEDARAMALITATNDRSWRHMVESGTTITWEAWDQKYKPNQDWNHAWGAAPANLLPRFVIGIQPSQPGWSQVRIRPHLSGLTSASGKVPTPRGAISLSWNNATTFRCQVALPKGIAAQLDLPASPSSTGVFLNNRPIAAQRLESRWIVRENVSGSFQCEVR